ncbi:amylosucrase [Actinomycetota bacterium]
MNDRSSVAATTADYTADRSWQALTEAERGIFTTRRDALWADVERPLRALYGDHAAYDQVLRELEVIIARAYAARTLELRLLDERRLATPVWFQRPDMVGYVCYTDRFAGTLREVPGRLDYLEELGVTYLHLMPLLRPRSGPNDGGYAVEDYRSVDPRLGTMDDLRDVATELRGRGMSLVVDLVCNHTAREHVWARKAIAGDRDYQDYYLMYPDRTMPDQWEQSLPEVFPDFAPGNFTWVDECSRWVWTTFNDYQWDLNYTNPRVFAEMLDVILALANQGVEVVRLDAVAFMWKRMGTNCQNQPEAHAILQAFRALTRIAAPGLILLAEAIVSPEDLVPYLGTGDATNKECELAYHNVLMVSLWSALAEGNARLLTRTLERMPRIPSGTAWLTYARLHDDIGWAVTDENAASVGLDGFLHRSFLSDFYSGAYWGSYAKGLVFQENPVTRDRRISGSLASLAGLERALAGGSEWDVHLAVQRILLLHNLVLAFGGVPLIYMGDEIGMLNDYSFTGQPDHADDNRWVHRPRMDWGAAERRHDPGTVEGRIFGGIRELARLRTQIGAFHAQADAVPVWLGNDSVFGLMRTSPRGRILVVANVSPGPQWVSLQGFDQLDPGSWLDDLVTGERTGWTFELPPYAVRWLVGTD